MSVIRSIFQFYDSACSQSWSIIPFVMSYKASSFDYAYCSSLIFLSRFSFIPLFSVGGLCKGVRCPPIFSLSNLIAGTNRKAYLLHASFALKDSHCQWSSILILLWSNNWCLNIYILMNCHNGHKLKAILTNEDKERLVTWPCWEIDYTVELVETTIRW